MKKMFLSLMVSLALLAGCTGYGPGQSAPGNQHSNSTIADLPKEDISADEMAALNSTLNDEYRAEAIYQKVIDKFGNVRPFTNIIGAEQKHSSALILIYEKYGLPVPANEWYGKVPEFDTVADACTAGASAEIENAALYDAQMSKVDNADIIATFTSLRDASLNNHLPAFQRCSDK